MPDFVMHSCVVHFVLEVRFVKYNLHLIIVGWTDIMITKSIHIFRFLGFNQQFTNRRQAKIYIRCKEFFPDALDSQR